MLKPAESWNKELECKGYGFFFSDDMYVYRTQSQSDAWLRDHPDTWIEVLKAALKAYVKHIEKVLEQNTMGLPIDGAEPYIDFFEGKFVPERLHAPLGEMTEWGYREGYGSDYDLFVEDEFKRIQQEMLRDLENSRSCYVDFLKKENKQPLPCSVDLMLYLWHGINELT